MPARTPGFTLIELVMVIVITAALAVFALPKVLDLSLWRLRSFGDDLIAQHQAAVRLSLQQRKPITVTITGTGVAWTYTSSGGVVSTLNCPATESPCIAEGGSRTVGLNANNSGLVITSSGAALPITVSSGSYSQAYAIENDTGLIHTSP